MTIGLPQERDPKPRAPVPGPAAGPSCSSRLDPFQREGRASSAGGRRPGSFRLASAPPELRRPLPPAGALEPGCTACTIAPSTPLLRELKTRASAWASGPPASAPAGHAGLQPRLLLQLPWRGLSAEPTPTRWAPPWHAPGGGRCSTCAAAKQRSPPLGPLPSNGAIRSGPGAWASRAAGRACSRSRPSCAVAAVGSSPTTGEPAAGGLAGRPAAGTAAAPCFLLWLWGPLSLAWGAPEPGEVGCRNRLRCSTASPCASHRRGGLQAIQGRCQAPAAVIRRAAVPHIPGRIGACLPCRGSGPRAPRDLLMALRPTRSPVAAPEARSGCVATSTAAVAGCKLQPEAAPPRPAPDWLPYVPACPSKALLPVADTLSARADLLAQRSRGFPLLRVARGPFPTPALAVEGRHCFAPDEAPGPAH